MKIREFLRGPLPGDALQELEAKYGAPLTRLYVVGFKGRYVNPDGKAEEVLKKYGLLTQSGVKTCTAGYSISEDRWIGPPAPAVGRYVDVASSDAIFVGAPKRCKAAEAKPAVADIIRLDKDFEVRFVFKAAGGKVQVVDRETGAVVKELSEKEVEWAELWCPVPTDILKSHLRSLAVTAERKKLDFRVMLSGAKGFHVLLTLERPVPAEWRPAIARKLAEWLDVEVDRAAFDTARKLRVPWTVHTETGRPAVFVDPETLEPVEFDWPRPIPYALAKTLAALGMSVSWSPPKPKSKPRRGGWVPYLEAVAAANPGLKSDCRKRFSALFGCGCAVDGINAEDCARRLAAALGLGELLDAYRQAVMRGFKACAKKIAEGGKPFFSIKRALSGEGGGKIWYSVKECITALPKLKWAAEEEPTAEALHVEEEKPVAEVLQPPPAATAEAVQQVEVLVAGVGGVETTQQTLGLEPEVAPAAASAEPPLPPPPDSEESCLANPICLNRLKLCIWRRLKVPKEEKKAALYAEIERRGELFAYCLKDAIEYARRESAEP